MVIKWTLHSRRPDKFIPANTLITLVHIQSWFPNNVSWNPRFPEGLTGTGVVRGYKEVLIVCSGDRLTIVLKPYPKNCTVTDCTCLHWNCLCNCCDKFHVSIQLALGHRQFCAGYEQVLKGMLALLLTAEPGRFVWVVAYTRFILWLLSQNWWIVRLNEIQLAPFKRKEYTLCNGRDWCGVK
jgi:hypothetical protein